MKIIRTINGQPYEKPSKEIIDALKKASYIRIEQLKVKGAVGK
jgi:hypothetical protein